MTLPSLVVGREADRAADAPAALGLAAWSRRIQEGSAYVLLFLLPFSKAAIEVLFVVWWAGWLLGLRARGPDRTRWLTAERRPLLLALAGYLAVCGLSMLWSSHPSKSLDGFVGKWSEYLWLFVMAVDLGARPGVMARCAAVIGVSAGVVVVEALTQHWFGAGLLRGYPFATYLRATGPYENPIDFATYLVMVLPVLAGFAMGRRGAVLGAAGILAAALTVFLVQTDALGAWLGLAFGVAAVAGIALVSRRSVWALALAGLLVAGGLAYGSRGWRAAFSTPDTGTVDRWMMWQAAIGMIRERPWLGHGVNTFMANYLDYWVGGEQQPRYAHNCYLQVAAETGLIGLVLFLVTLGAIFRRVLTRLDRLPAGRRGILLGGAVALAAFAVQAAIDTNFYSLRQAVLFWTLAGLIVGSREQERAA